MYKISKYRVEVGEMIIIDIQTGKVTRRDSVITEDIFADLGQFLDRHFNRVSDRVRNLSYRQLQKELKILRQAGLIERSFKLNQKKHILQERLERHITESDRDVFRFRAKCAQEQKELIRA
ncbi:MAG: hypothetical protein F6K24_16380 [Okeania sp. SIO2D1]|nr:hypothetical protein [Okeania sp. SIO2D1]